MVGNPRSKNCSMAPCFGPTSHKPAQYSAVLFSFLDERHRNRGIEERVYLSPELSVLLFPPTTHFRITLSHVRIHFPHEQTSMTSQANSPHSSLLLGHGTRKRPNLGTLKNHRKLTKIATTIIFSQR